MRYNFFIALLLLFFSHENAANAAAVTNLSKQPQTIELQTGDGWKPQVIEAGTTFRATGDLQLKYMMNEVFIEHDMEYAIWPDGKLGPQRHIRTDKPGI